MHIFFAEEEHESITDSKSLWIIDPISNTFNFIHGLPHYSICVAHYFQGEVIFSLIYDPSMKELFHAQKNSWAFLNWEKIAVSKNTQDLSLIIGPHLVPINPDNKQVIQVIGKLCTLGTIRIIWSLWIAYAYVACWRAEATVSLPIDIFPEMAWKLLVEEAWGRFTDFQNKTISLESRQIVASNWLIHESIIKNLPF